MKTIKLHYDLETGNILGYFTEDQSHIPVPYITISELEYSAILGKELDYKVYNKELISKEEFPEERKFALEKFSKCATEFINKKAQEAKMHGILLIDEKYYVNSSWLNYYQALLDLLDSDLSEVCLKLYDFKDDSYTIKYEKLSTQEAKTLCTKIIADINNYRDQYIPNKVAEASARVKELLKVKNYKEIKSFCDKLEYGTVIKD